LFEGDYKTLLPEFKKGIKDGDTIDLQNRNKIKRGKI